MKSMKLNLKKKSNKGLVLWEGANKWLNMLLYAADFFLKRIPGTIVSFMILERRSPELMFTLIKSANQTDQLFHNDFLSFIYS